MGCLGPGKKEGLADCKSGPGSESEVVVKQMSWLPNDFDLCGQGKEQANSARSLEFMSVKVCEEGRALDEDYKHNKRKETQW